MNRPDGNLTGMTIFFGELLPKRLEFLRELVPSAAHRPAPQPEQPNSEARSRDAREAARAVGQNILIVRPAASAIYCSVRNVC